MLSELTNLPIDTLLDIVFVILAGGQPLSLSEVGELEQIQLELQRRGELEGCAFVPDGDPVEGPMIHRT